MIRVGIIGNGETIGIAKSHIEAYKLAEEAEITALYDILPGRAESYIEKLDLKNAKACKSYEELLSLVDAVSICTPNFTHIDLAVKALKAGKHVLCEKPFGVNEADTLEAVNYAKVSGLVCMIGLCYRYIPGMLYMKKAIDEGKLGDIYYVRQTLGGGRIANPDVKLEWRMQKPLSGPGALADFGSHMLDIADILIQERAGKITEVNCMENTFIKERQVIGRDHKDAVTNGDVAVFSARTQKGVLLSFTASRLASSHAVEVVGSGGCMSFDGENPFQVTVQLKDQNGIYGAKEVVEVPEELYLADDKTPKKRFLINFYLEIKQFLTAVKNNGSVATDFERGAYIQKLIDALQQSADTGETVKING